MKLYLIKRPDNEPAGYDDYDAAVVAAESEDEARTMGPCGVDGDTFGWISPDRVIVTLIGDAKSSLLPGVVLASFNAG